MVGIIIPLFSLFSCTYPFSLEIIFHNINIKEFHYSKMLRSKLLITFAKYYPEDTKICLLKGYTRGNLIYLNEWGQISEFITKWDANSLVGLGVNSSILTFTWMS